MHFAGERAARSRQLTDTEMTQVPHQFGVLRGVEPPVPDENGVGTQFPGNCRLSHP